MSSIPSLPHKEQTGLALDMSDCYRFGYLDTIFKVLLNSLSILLINTVEI